MKQKNISFYFANLIKGYQTHQFLILLIGICLSLIYFIQTLIPFQMQDDLSFFHNTMNKDFWQSILLNYLTNNARFGDILIRAMMLTGDKILFNLLGSIVYIGLVLAIFYLAKGRMPRSNFDLLLIILIFTIYFTFTRDSGVTGAVIWATGIPNYLFTTFIWVVYFILFRSLLIDTKQNKFIQNKLPLIFSLIFFGFFSGWSNEHSLVGVLFFLSFTFLYSKFVLKKNIQWYYFSGFIFTILGSCIIFLSPSNEVRRNWKNSEGLSAYPESLEWVKEDLFHRVFISFFKNIEFFLQQNPILVLVLIIITLKGSIAIFKSFKNKKQSEFNFFKNKNILALFFIICAFIVSWAFYFGTGFSVTKNHPRSFVPFTFIVLAIICFIDKPDKKKNLFFFYSLLFICIINFIYILYLAVDFNQLHKKRLKIIQNSSPNETVQVPPIIKEKYVRKIHMGQGIEFDSRLNLYYAKYYNVQAIEILSPLNFFDQAINVYQNSVNLNDKMTLQSIYTYQNKQTDTHIIYLKIKIKNFDGKIPSIDLKSGYEFNLELINILKPLYTNKQTNLFRLLPNHWRVSAKTAHIIEAKKVQNKNETNIIVARYVDSHPRLIHLKIDKNVFLFHLNKI